MVVGGFEELEGGWGAGGSETRLRSPWESIDGCEETASRIHLDLFQDNWLSNNLLDRRQVSRDKLG
jgi:hypothetical protein